MGVRVFVAFVLASACLASCNVVRAPRSPTLDSRARWIVLPAANHSSSPQAGERLEAILVTLLRTRGVLDVDTYVPPREAEAAVLDDVMMIRMSGKGYASFVEMIEAPAKVNEKLLEVLQRPSKWNDR